MAGKTKRPPRSAAVNLDDSSLYAEIRLLRELVHQVATGVKADSFKEEVRLLDAVGRACGQLARLLRTQDQLGDQATLAEEIGRIADEVRRELSMETEG